MPAQTGSKQTTLPQSVAQDKIDTNLLDGLRLGQAGSQAYHHRRIVIYPIIFYFIDKMLICWFINLTEVLDA